MSVGKMDKKIILQKPVKVADGMGGSKTTWQDVTAVWAEFITPNVSTTVMQGTIASELMRKLSIWKRDDVRMGWRVLKGNKTYSVEHAYPYDDLHTTLICKEVVK